MRTIFENIYEFITTQLNIMFLRKKRKTKEEVRKLHWLVGRHFKLDLTTKRQLYLRSDN